MGQRTALGLVFVMILARGYCARAGVTYFDDFSTGLNAFWTVEKTSQEYSVDASHGDVRLASAGGGGYGYRAVRIHFKPTVIGDFDMKVQFHDAKLDLIDNLNKPSANHIALHAQVGSVHFTSVRDIAFVDGSNYHVYMNPPSANFGVVPTTLLAGELEVKRLGSVYSSWFNGTKIYESSLSSVNPSDLWFSLENNLTNDAIAITYDNFSINADDIKGIPESAAVGVVSCLALCARRPRTARRVRTDQ